MVIAKTIKDWWASCSFFVLALAGVTVVADAIIVVAIVAVAVVVGWPL